MKSRLPECPATNRLDAPGSCDLEPHHHVGNRRIFVRKQDGVDVIGHETVSANCDRRILASANKRFRKQTELRFVERSQPLALARNAPRRRNRSRHRHRSHRIRPKTLPRDGHLRLSPSLGQKLAKRIPSPPPHPVTQPSFLGLAPGVHSSFVSRLTLSNTKGSLQPDARTWMSGHVTG